MWSLAYAGEFPACVLGRKASVALGWWSKVSLCFAFAASVMSAVPLSTGRSLPTISADQCGEDAGAGIQLHSHAGELPLIGLWCRVSPSKPLSLFVSQKG